MKKIQNNFGLHKGRTQPMNREQRSQYSINRYVCKDIFRDFALKRFTNNIFMKYALLDQERGLYRTIENVVVNPESYPDQN